MSGDRQEAILSALSAELERQSSAGGSASALRLSGADSDRLVDVSGRLDVLALATAIDAALGGDTLDAAPVDAKRAPRGGAAPKEAADQGLTPDELDASNDE